MRSSTPCTRCASPRRERGHCRRRGGWAEELVERMLTWPLTAPLSQAARPSLKPSKLAVEGATDGDRTQRRVDSRRVSSESWLHGHNDPRLTQLEVRRRPSGLPCQPADLGGHTVTGWGALRWSARAFRPMARPAAQCKRRCVAYCTAAHTGAQGATPPCRTAAVAAPLAHARRRAAAGRAVRRRPVL
eukprot:7348643-Prymnesium_polylepis.3